MSHLSFIVSLWSHTNQLMSTHNVQGLLQLARVQSGEYFVFLSPDHEPPEEFHQDLERFLIQLQMRTERRSTVDGSPVYRFSHVHQPTHTS